MERQEMHYISAKYETLLKEMSNKSIIKLQLMSNQLS